MPTQELKNQVISLRKEGKTYDQIHEITKVAKSSISDICRSENLGEQKIIELTPEIIQNLQKLYDDLGSLKKVAKQSHISVERLSKVLILKNRVQTISKSEAVISWRKRAKLKLIECKGGKCQCCGYKNYAGALEFHHLDPNEKDFTISGSSKAFDKLIKEIDKCILVCSNCHKEIHAGLIEI